MAEKEADGAGHIARGILIGGSVGVFAALFGILPGLFWACGLGMLAGFLAGATLSARRKKR